MGSDTKTERDKHAAGGPGKSPKEGHLDPHHGNKPGQHQTPKERGPGEGGTGGRHEDRERAPS
jgi:hypothetical protein